MLFDITFEKLITIIFQGEGGETEAEREIREIMARREAAAIIEEQQRRERDMREQQRETASPKIPYGVPVDNEGGGSMFQSHSKTVLDGNNFLGGRSFLVVKKSTC